MFILDLDKKGFMVDTDKQTLDALKKALGWKGKYIEPLASVFGIRTNPSRKSTEVQSIIFDKKCYTPAKAQKWLESHNFKVKKMDETDDFYRFRQLSPVRFDEFRTIDFTDNGCIKAIIGLPVG